MRAVLIAGLVVVAAAPPLAADAKKPPPAAHVSEAGKYKAAFPGAPKSTTKDYTSPSGLLPVTVDKYEVASDLYLSVTYTDYPPAFGDVAAKAIYDGVAKALKGEDGEITMDVPITLGKHDGRHLRIAFGKSGEKVVVAHLYLVGRRLYQVMATGTKNTIQRADVESFLSSFSITE